MSIYVRMQAFIQALLAVAVFGIMTEFSDKGTHPQDKHSYNWGSRGEVGGSPVNFAILCI